MKLKDSGWVTATCRVAFHKIVCSCDPLGQFKICDQKQIPLTARSPKLQCATQQVLHDAMFVQTLGTGFWALGKSIGSDPVKNTNNTKFGTLKIHSRLVERIILSPLSLLSPP